MKNRQWIQDALDLNYADVGKMYESKLGMDFLMTWSLLESRCFGGNLTQDKLKNYTMRCGACDSAMAEIFKHFHQRYQEQDKLDLFMKDHDNVWFRQQLAKKSDQVSCVEKTRFVMYVIDRYKGYIFDQNDDPTRWQTYEKELNYCIDAMQEVFDYQQAYHRQLTDNHDVNKMSTIELVSYISLENK